MPLFSPPPDEMKVYARNALANSAASTVTYEGHAVVSLGESKITADRVVVFTGRKKLVAEGHVTRTGTEGTIQADRLETGYGSAKPPPDEIRIDAQKTRANQAEGSTTWQGNVVVRYGATKVTADRLQAFESEKRAVAEGHITLVDPDGTAQADRLEFSWDPLHRIGSGRGITIRVGSTLLRAREATFEPGKWTLRGVEATSCLRPKPVYLITSDLVTVIPDKEAYIHQPRVSLLGKFIAELPTQRPPISPAAPGLRYPSPQIRRHGLGATWGGGVLVGHDGTFTFDARAATDSKPSSFALYTKSFVPVSKATEIVAPRTDFAERFGYGYLDSILIQSPDDEARFLQATRASLSGGGQLNGSVSDRDRRTRYSKAEAVYESGSASDGFGVLGQVRLQGIQREDDGMKARLNLNGSVGLPSQRLGANLRTLSRLDANLFAGSTLFGWARGMAGIVYMPQGWLRLSGGVYGSGEAGDPEFPIDPLYSKNGLLARADIVNGGFRLSYLTKRDFRRGDYDREFTISQVIGCVEFSYVAREYPRDQRYGLTLRLQPLIDLARRRGSELGQGLSAP